MTGFIRKIFDDIFEHPTYYIRIYKTIVPIVMEYEGFPLFERFSIFRSLHDDYVCGRREFKKYMNTERDGKQFKEFQDDIPILFECNIEIESSDVKILNDIILYGKKKETPVSDKIIFVMTQIFTREEIIQILTSNGLSCRFARHYISKHKDSYFCVNGKYYAFPYNEYMKYVKETHKTWKFAMDAKINKYNGLPIVFSIQTNDEKLFFTTFNNIVLHPFGYMFIEYKCPYGGQKTTIEYSSFKMLDMLYNIFGKEFNEVLAKALICDNDHREFTTDVFFYMRDCAKKE